MAPRGSAKVNRSQATESTFVQQQSRRGIQTRIASLPPQEISPTTSKRQRLDPSSPNVNQERTKEQDSCHESPPILSFEAKEDQPVVENSNFDYMQQWLPKINDHIEALYACESHPAKDLCSCCGLANAIWKCTSCFAQPLLCTACCKGEHDRRPYHRIKMWTGKYYEDSWLWKVGVAIYTGHDGECCPNADALTAPDLSPQEFQNAAHSTSNHHNDFSYGASSYMGKQEQSAEIVVVHSNGIHHLPLVPCRCEARAEEGPHADTEVTSETLVIQLLKLGLFPSSFKDVKTVFTFDVLNDFHLDTLECNTSGWHFYSKLRRKTNAHFPNVVENRYRELLRVARQYDFLRLIIQFLYFRREQATEEGSLALFCAACPQPGKNLPDDWKEDPNPWKYFMSFVVDGNFVCAHLKGKGAGQDIFLKSGQGYFAGLERYMAHVDSKKREEEPKSTCNEFRAVADRNKFHKGYDATGIAAFACARHGCIVPSSVVDFQRGERQLNVDYGLCQTVRMVVSPEVQRLFLLYDIACHYCVNLLDRVEHGEYLYLPELLEIVFGIGQFHVHGHQERCFARFSPMFIEGLGRVAGEILESDWSIINPVGLLCIAMTYARRMEVLDSKMLDLNWKKMVGLVASLPKLHDEATLSLRESEEALELFIEGTSRTDRAAWEKQLAHAQAERIQGNIAAMDVLQASVYKVPSRKDVQATLMTDEDACKSGLGISCWVAEGISIQEAQIALLTVIAASKKNPTDAKRLDERQRRQGLLRRITNHINEAATLFPHIANQGAAFVAAPIREPCRCEEGDVCGHLGMDVNPFHDIQGENVASLEVPLPSCALNPLLFDQTTIQKEVHLRAAQADEALQGLRQEIGLKTFLFKANKRLAATKSERVRGFAGITAANREIDRYVRIYNQARWALRRLSPHSSLLSRYQSLSKQDLRPLKTVYSANTPGATTDTTPWIWNIGFSETKSLADSPYMVESMYPLMIADIPWNLVANGTEIVARINYLRALCRRDRWQEERILVTSEMDWVIRFFEQSASAMDARLSQDGPIGFIEAVARKRDLWRKMALQARGAFQSYLKI
ncbi:hypothetical protein BKA70DRAFT_1447738 [Coprinopsis sp. MPI-PUGE-AT-0042]|nr:hypothetical protein BKA70DRAFT_1447738 [Coprinopsis sp. MPI-PUGE-AT-0042]